MNEHTYNEATYWEDYDEESYWAAYENSRHAGEFEAVPLAERLALTRPPYREATYWPAPGTTAVDYEYDDYVMRDIDDIPY